jgi:hypothetical protein
MHTTATVQVSRRGTETTCAREIKKERPTVAAHAMAPAPSHKIVSDKITVDLIKVTQLAETLLSVSGKRERHRSSSSPLDITKLECTVKSLSGGKCCCFGSSRRVLEFKTPDESVAMTRDQNNETLALLAGQNILIAAALTYAVDRFFKMIGSKLEKEHRERSAQNVGVLFGLIGVAVAMSVDSGKKKVQHRDIFIEDFKQQ